MPDEEKNKEDMADDGCAQKPETDSRPGFLKTLAEKAHKLLERARRSRSSDEMNIKPAQEGMPAKGNIFTRLFGSKEQPEKQSESIIETIVAQSGRKKHDGAELAQKEPDAKENLIKFAVALLKFSLVFIAVSAGFFYIFNIDRQNRVLGMAGMENYAIRLKKAADTLESKKAEEAKINDEIALYKKGYSNRHEGIIKKIILNRMNWPELIRRLNEVTEYVYEKNSLAKYVQYNNYSYDADTGRLSVNAALIDPLGKNLTKLAELEEAFKYYPKDKSKPDDKSLPYFYNVNEFRTYTKALDKTTGRYKSNFSLSLYAKQPPASDGK